MLSMRRFRFAHLSAASAAVLVISAAACGGPDSTTARAVALKSSRDSLAAASTESTTTGAGAATAGARGGAAGDAARVPRVLILGTSLTAGYGLDDPGHDAYPAELQRMADSAGVRANIVNAGLSGETSAGALRRVDWLLKQKPDVVVIETGANDGLRGLNPDSTAANIRELIERIRADNARAKILLVQMEAPTNLGPQYTRAFHALFGRVAAAEKVELAPFLLNGVAGVPMLNQADGIHPTPSGARIAAQNIWPSLKDELK
jgi:acyl-CoA thioesterase-1